MADEIDPLDAYMASLGGEVVQQATLSSDDIDGSGDKIFFSSRGVKESPPSSGVAIQTGTSDSPSPAQLNIVSKVIASPHCNILGKGIRARQRWYTGTGDQDASEGRSVEELCLKLLKGQPSEFLRQVLPRADESLA